MRRQKGSENVNQKESVLYMTSGGWSTRILSKIWLLEKILDLNVCIYLYEG